MTPSLPCPNRCRRLFDNQRQVSAHKRYCTKTPQASADLIQKRKAELDAEAARKKIRLEQNRVSLAHQEQLQTGIIPATPVRPGERSSRYGRRMQTPRHLRDCVPSSPSRSALPSHLAEVFPHIPQVDTSPGSPLGFGHTSGSGLTLDSPLQGDVSLHTDFTPSDATPPAFVDTPPDDFGVFRRYYGRTHPPSQIPEDAQTLEDVCDAPGLHPPRSEEEAAQEPTVKWISRNNVAEDPKVWYAPFANPSQAKLANWKHTVSSSGTISTSTYEDLLTIWDESQTENWSIREDGFTARKSDQLLDDPLGFSKDVFSEEWNKDPFSLPLPKTSTKKGLSEANAPRFAVDGGVTRNIMPIIEDVATNTTSRHAKQYQYDPHGLFWIPPGHSRKASSRAQSPSTPSTPSRSDSPPVDPPTPIRIYTDVVNSPALLAEEEKLRSLPRQPHDLAELPYGILPMILWSDATHLSSFGDAKLWPVYLYFAHLCKYTRGRPTEFAAHHIAYIPSLPDTIEEAYADIFGNPPTEEIMRFLRRELFQEIWLRLMNTDFMEAYEKGVVYECTDGVTRRLFPGSSHIQRTIRRRTPEDMQRRQEKCRVDDVDLHKVISTARAALFKGSSIMSKKVQDLLRPQSLNPIQNAFSRRLSKFGVNSYDLFAPDVMHELELGVWKGTFHHLMRMLESLGANHVQEFNNRMQQMPTFGNGRLQMFRENVSSRKGLAARDYESFLITMMPAMEGLLPLADNEVVQDMLFELANFHALSKLRMQTDVTLDIMDDATTHMYDSMRRFATMAGGYVCVESEEEAKARELREAQNTSTAPSSAPTASGSATALAQSPEPTTVSVRLTSAPKKTRGSRRKPIPKKAKHPAEDLIHNQPCAPSVAPTLAEPNPATGTSTHSKASSAPADAHEHYEIGDSDKTRVRIRDWVIDHFEDPATKGFIPCLHEHLLGRMLGQREATLHPDSPFTFTQEEHNGFKSSMQDCINPRTHGDIMMLAPNDASHPYLYARVIKTCFKFLQVRWFEVDDQYTTGFLHRRQFRLKFVDHTQYPESAFGFVDPADVLRSAYIVPAFDHGKVDASLPDDSLARCKSKVSLYRYYYVMMFADRDIFMRHLGGGVGHQSEGIHVEDSLEHAQRAPRPRSRHWEDTNGARLVGKNVEHTRDDINLMPDEAPGSPIPDSTALVGPQDTTIQAEQPDLIAEQPAEASDEDQCEALEDALAGLPEFDDDDDDCCMHDEGTLDALDGLATGLEVAGVGGDEEDLDEFDVIGYVRW
ncbi:uncharacterized protein BXZ73DRAFT_106270 [Epithele typhae]|uniref:uncharacterized protein n=1 Tax=Epithele typhae TaxID=378194 RepID=UPI002008A488|nr:uncharacterized protein BXZ73DRAFT_106270 [Epithele typhae]KAH9915299.1 hypothetical protein BXZ73DRAFT_106270 [Epithele typhae]